MARTRSLRIAAAQGTHTSTQAHTSTSELVKIKPRKKRGRTPPPVQERILPEDPPTMPELRPRIYQKMVLVHYDELAVIWDADKRIPSVASRRAWAYARNIKPEHVHRWWSRRKDIARKARITIPKGTYELHVGTAPVITETVKEEQRSPEPSNKPPKAQEPFTCPISPTITTLNDSAPSTSDRFHLLPSDTTVVVETSASPTEQESCAYDLPKLCFDDQNSCDKVPEDADYMLPSSPLPPSSPASSSPEPAPVVSPLSTTVTKRVNPTLLKDSCNYGASDSSFTCSLCKSSPSGIVELNLPLIFSRYRTKVATYRIYQIPKLWLDESGTTLRTTSQ